MFLLKEYEFKVYDIGCGGVREEVRVSRSGAWLIVEGVVNIPDPCHTIKIFPESKVDDKVLLIHLKASKIKVICIQCVAHARFSVKINVFHLRQQFNTNKIRVSMDYYVRGRSAVLYDEEIEI